MPRLAFSHGARSVVWGRGEMAPSRNLKGLALWQIQRAFAVKRIREAFDAKRTRENSATRNEFEGEGLHFPAPSSRLPPIPPIR